MDETHVTLTAMGDAHVIGLPADVGAGTEDALLPIVDEIFAASPRLIVVDFGRVESTNSAGVGLLFDLLRRSRQHHVPVVLASIRAQPKLVVERVQLTRYADVFATVEEAIASVRS